VNDLEGFARFETPRGFALICESLFEEIRESGLLEPWSILADSERTIRGTGRGPRALIEVGGGRVILLKQYLRGGWPAKLNAARYASPLRFLAEAKVGRDALVAGLPVVPMAGVVLRRARPGWNAWGMSLLWENAFDLARWLTGRTPGRDGVSDPDAVWASAMKAVAEVFSGGLYHRDLNLGNLIVREAVGEGAFEARVIDLDRAVFFSASLAGRLRARVCRRIERSYLKVCGADGPISASRRREDYRRLTEIGR